MMFTAMLLIGLYRANAGAAAIDRCHFIKIAAASTTAAVILRREKFIYREFKGIKQFARIFIFAADTAVIGTILIRQTEIMRGNQKLNISFQFNDRKLAKSDYKYITVRA